MTVPMAGALAEAAGTRALSVSARLDAVELTIEDLVAAIKDLDEVREGIVQAQQEMVNALREADVTWQRVGELLGMSRQSAWERWRQGGSPHGHRR